MTSRKRDLPTLHSDRLTLRTLSAADLHGLIGIFGPPEVTQYFGHGPVSDLAAAHALLAEIHEGAVSNTLFQWGIELRDRHLLIGTVTLSEIDAEHRRAEIGFALRPDAQGHGYAREAVSAILDHAFTTMQLHRITADSDPRNQPSLRLLRDLGFTEEGRLRRHHRKDGAWQDGVLFGMLEEEWRRRSAK